MAEFEVKRNAPYYGENETCMNEIMSFTAGGNTDYLFYGMYDYTSNCYLIFSSLANLEVHTIHFECEDDESISDFETRLSSAIYENFGEYTKLLKVSTTYSLMNEMEWN